MAVSDFVIGRQCIQYLVRTVAFRWKFTASPNGLVFFCGLHGTVKPIQYITEIYFYLSSLVNFASCKEAWKNTSWGRSPFAQGRPTNFDDESPQPEDRDGAAAGEAHAYRSGHGHGRGRRR